MLKTEDTDVVVVGAGPYGLSIAAHLDAGGVEFRIFGRPMESWRTRMPAGMLLKSDGCASNLSDPSGRSTLERFSRDNGIPYRDHALPISLDTFTRYGVDFHRRLVPMVEETNVTSVDKHADGFELRLETGEVVRARRVVVAVGLGYFRHVPPALRAIPAGHLSHSSEHADLGVFAGRDVTVIGGGQSALETAALLHEHDVDTRVIVRAPRLAWNPAPGASPRPVRRRVRRPMGGLGAGWRTVFYAEAPMAFRHLPERNRQRAVRTALGPAGASWLRERVEGRIPLLIEHEVAEAGMVGEHVRLRVEGTGDATEIITDHVIAATGYRIDLETLPFLEPSMLSRVRRVRRAPKLSANFESSVPGLYFVGQVAAPTFGPVMRFVYGADFTARTLARHLATPLGHHRWTAIMRRACRG
jgi:thioredoxin reductase